MTAARLLAVGTGAPGKADRGLYEKIGGALAARPLSSGEMHLVVDVTGTESSAQLNPAASIALGAVLRSRRPDEYRTKLPEKRKPTLARITLVGGAQDTEQRFPPLDAGAQGVFLTPA